MSEYKDLIDLISDFEDELTDLRESVLLLIEDNKKTKEDINRLWAIFEELLRRSYE